MKFFDLLHPSRATVPSGIKKALTVAVVSALLTAGAYVPVPAREQPKTVVLGGQPFGIKFFSDGVMVVGLEDFESGGKTVNPARDGGLKEGDVIKKVGDTAVSTNGELQQATAGCAGQPIRFTVLRNGKELVRTVTPEENADGVFLLGAWVRDSCAGIGTVTYYDPADRYFAALGHGVCDRDTAALMPLGKAEAVQAGIRSVTKSTAGKAGSLNGYLTDTPVGNLTKNTPCGIYGTINDNFPQSGITLDLSEKGEVHVGKAQIYTTLDGDSCACYDAEITRICNLDAQSNENFVIKVTDRRLLSECGGIVQGMSGSPVVQDGKLAGAVTHVFVNSPHEGYGITAQNMVSNYQR